MNSWNSGAEIMSTIYNLAGGCLKIGMQCVQKFNRKAIRKAIPKPRDRDELEYLYTVKKWLRLNHVVLTSTCSGGKSSELTDLQIELIHGSWEKVKPNKKYHGERLFHKWVNYLLMLAIIPLHPNISMHILHTVL